MWKLLSPRLCTSTRDYWGKNNKTCQIFNARPVHSKSCSDKLHQYWINIIFSKPGKLCYVKLKLMSKFIFTARKRSLGQGNIFRSVCQEFCPQGGSAWPGTPPGPGRYTPPGTRQVHPPAPGSTPPGTRQVHPPPGPGRFTPPGPGRYTPPDQAGTPPPRYGQRAGGTHPTGMQSCN